MIFLGFTLDLKTMLLIIKLYNILKIEPKYISMNQVNNVLEIMSWMKNKAHDVNNPITNYHSLRLISTFIK